MSHDYFALQFILSFIHVNLNIGIPYYRVEESLLIVPFIAARGYLPLDLLVTYWDSFRIFPQPNVARRYTYFPENPASPSAIPRLIDKLRLSDFDTYTGLFNPDYSHLWMRHYYREGRMLQRYGPLGAYWVESLQGHVDWYLIQTHVDPYFRITCECRTQWNFRINALVYHHAAQVARL